MNQLLNIATEDPKVDCPACGSNSVSSKYEVEYFQYGDKKESEVELSVQIQVHHCESCDFLFTNEDASEARHDVVCRHLGVLTPREVRGVREQYSLSQAQFSELSKIGKASLARWESGSLIQNQANDNLLYLLSYKDNLAHLQERTSFQRANTRTLFANVISLRSKFRAISESEIGPLRLQAERFELFPMAMGG